MSGTIYIISAPSGAGKTTLVNNLLAHVNHIKPSISYTTRPPRQGEVTGRDYHFIDRELFKSMQNSDAFIESAEVFGNYYGTAKAEMASMLMSDDVVLEIDWQGAEQVRHHTVFDLVSIYIVPPSLDSLASRLTARSSESNSQIQTRLKQASSDLSHCHHYDYIVINDDFDVAAEELKSIVLGLR